MARPVVTVSKALKFFVSFTKEEFFRGTLGELSASEAWRGVTPRHEITVALAMVIDEAAAARSAADLSGGEAELVEAAARAERAAAAAVRLHSYIGMPMGVSIREVASAGLSRRCHWAVLVAEAVEDWKDSPSARKERNAHFAAFLSFPPGGLDPEEVARMLLRGEGGDAARDWAVRFQPFPQLWKGLREALFWA